MINKAMKQYLEDINNIDSNYQSILSKSKGGSNMKITMKKILSIAAIFIIIVFIGTITPGIYAKIQWNITFKEFQNRQSEYATGCVKEAVESGYNEVMNMDYITQDGIGVKVDSLIITDDYFEAKMDFKFDEDIKVNSQTFGYGYAIYDDQNNIYGIQTRMHIGMKNSSKYDMYWKYLYEELGVKYNKKDVFAVEIGESAGTTIYSAENRNIKTISKMETTKGFPKSKKIYIRIFDLGYSMLDFETVDGNKKLSNAEAFSLSDAEWRFEIDVPEKFYERETISLKLKDKIPGVEIEKINVTEVGLILVGKINNLSEFLNSGKDMDSESWENARHEKLNITDEDGNVYYETTLGTTSKVDGFRAIYQINKNNLNKKLFLNINIDGKKYSSELVK